MSYGQVKAETAARLISTISVAGLLVAALAGARLVIILVALGMGGSTAFVGLTAAMFTLMPTLTSIRFGRWVDKAGTYVPVFATCLMTILAGLLFLANDSIWMLIPIAGLTGASAFFASAIASRSVGSLAEGDRRTQLIGYLVLGYSVAGFVGPLVMSTVYEKTAPVFSVVSISVFGGMALLLLIGGFHHYRNVLPEAVSAEKVKKGRTSALLKLSALRGWVVINAVFATSQTLFPLVISLHSVELKLSAFFAGLIIGGFAIGMALARLVIGYCLTLVSPEKLVVIALVTAAGLYAILPFLSSPVLLVLCSAGIGVPLGMALPLSLSLIYSAAPEGRINEAVGLSYSFTGMFQTLAPLVLGFAAQNAGTVLITSVIAVLLFTAGGVTMMSVVVRRSRRAKNSTAEEA